MSVKYSNPILVLYNAIKIIIISIKCTIVRKITDLGLFNKSKDPFKKYWIWSLFFKPCWIPIKILFQELHGEPVFFA